MANCIYHFQFQMSLPVDAIKIILKTSHIFLELNDAIFYVSSYSKYQMFSFELGLCCRKGCDIVLKACAS